MIVLAYALLSFSIIESNSLPYQLLNFIGALGVGSISFYKKTYQPGVLNIIWAVIALAAIINIFFID